MLSVMQEMLRVSNLECLAWNMEALSVGYFQVMLLFFFSSFFTLKGRVPCKFCFNK